MPKKYFTLEEANSLLEPLKQELEQLQSIKKDFEHKYEQIEQIKNFVHTLSSNDAKDALFTLECQIEFLQIEAKTHLHNFQMHGVEIKDIETGLLDFPSMLNGEEILLCWRQGEAQISHYHGIHDGFAGRKKIIE